MNLYFVNIDEYNLLKSFKDERLSTNSNFEEKINDYLVFLVENKISAVAKIIDEGRIEFTQIFESESRLNIVGIVRNLLLHEWGNKIEESINANIPVSNKTAKHILNELDKHNCSLSYFLTEIEHLIELAEKNKNKKDLIEIKQRVKSKNTSIIENKNLNKATEHTKAQYYLKEIAKITNCDVWTANNDKNRKINGSTLGVDDIATLPQFEMDVESKKRISLIDTLWFKNDFPVSAFEVETSTTIYSGLLRMADFVSVMPNKNMKLYIVAPINRKDKVMKELDRPIFRAIGMNQLCKFISIENLEIMYQKIKGLNGYIQYDVLDAIALDVNELEYLVT